VTTGPSGLAIGTWKDEDDVAETWQPTTVVSPSGPSRRERWLAARSRAVGWVSELSSLDF